MASASSSSSLSRDEQRIEIIKAHLKTLSPKFIYDHLLFGPNWINQQKIMALLKPTWEEYQMLVYDDADSFCQLLSYCLLDYAHLERDNLPAEDSEDDEDDDRPKCEAVLKSGKRKGQSCGKIMPCKTHK
jgi:hypothetical protein